MVAEQVGVGAYLKHGLNKPNDGRRRTLTIMSRVVIWSPLDPALLRDGYLAGRRGLTAHDNPYLIGTREALAWGIGWVKGLDKQLRVVDCSRSAKSTPDALAQLK
jgi:hypothetical protein